MDGWIPDEVILQNQNNNSSNAQIEAVDSSVKSCDEIIDTSLKANEPSLSESSASVPCSVSTEEVEVAESDVDSTTSNEEFHHDLQQLLEYINHRKVCHVEDDKSETTSGDSDSRSEDSFFLLSLASMEERKAENEIARQSNLVEIADLEENQEINDSFGHLQHIYENAIEIADPNTPKNMVEYLEKVYKTPNNPIKQEISATESVKTYTNRIKRLPKVLNDYEDVLENLFNREEAMLHLRSPALFNNKPTLPRVRAILLDWLMEVCDVYCLSRNTFYLAIDYVDRYLSMGKDVPKSQIQLLGVTSLFVAAKFEEIYPPRLATFVDICAGACTREDMVTFELILILSLEWNLCPMTPAAWLRLYMQIHTCGQDSEKNVESFIFPQFSAYDMAITSHTMDLFCLDPNFLNFNYSTIAAAAMYFKTTKKAARTASGLTWKQIRSCVKYLRPFHQAIIHEDNPNLLMCASSRLRQQDDTLRYLKALLKKSITDDSNCIQPHVIGLSLLASVILRRFENLSIKINRVVYAKNEDSLGNISYKCNRTDSEDDGANTVLMYEVNPGSLVFDEDEIDTCHPTDPDYELGAVNIFALRARGTVMLDDLMSSLLRLEIL